MAKCYFELRKQSARGSDSIAADMMRHLHTRQHLGRALVICEHPAVVLSAARKQWMKLSRVIQKQRASTLNADKILKYTHTITHMQHMRFTAKTVLEDPDADVYFLRASQLDAAPLQCFSIYLTTTLPATIARFLVEQLPVEALVIDYNQAAPWAELDLQPKRLLETQVHNEWRQTQQFLTDHDITITRLLSGSMQDIEAMDDALDTLLGVSHQFLQYASGFQHSLELARPLRISKDMRQQYDTLSLLAHRVQALTSSAFTQRFLETYNEDDTFFLYDYGRQRLAYADESLADTVSRHARAGRQHLAEALQQTYMGRSLSPHTYPI